MTPKQVYDSARWRKLRELKLKHAKHLCELCLAHGRVEASDIVDHRISMSQGGEPFPPLDGLAVLCKPHHDRKSRAEQQGRVFVDSGVLPIPLADRGCDEYGNPFNPASHWNR